ncbi:hypothetical protein COL922a_014165 [Colletotrichum nupharicola]|nr:hypothetical protein COL922a_014165 [Colletotrichum nupharicola]
MIHPGAKLICELEVDTATVDKKPKNHRWYNRAPVYFMVTVIVKLVIEPAGLQFELWNAAGQRITSLSRPWWVWEFWESDERKWEQRNGTHYDSVGGACGEDAG